jgi:hypothetical protein
MAMERIPALPESSRGRGEEESRSSRKLVVPKG